MLQYITISAILIFETDAICPPGLDVQWEELGNNCYHVSKFRMESMGEAKEYCWEIGGYLAEIRTQDEESLLDSYLIAGISYWIGLSDMDHEGQPKENEIF